MIDLLTPAIREHLIQLDMALTGKDRRTAEHTARNSSCGRYENVYYLSDGGYSRVAINVEDGHLFPTSNSLDKVKQAWSRPDVQKLVSEITALIKAQMSHAA